MTETALREIVRRAVNDAAFRAQLRSDPAKALSGIGLTGEERSALSSGDPARLTSLGIDERISKAFTSLDFSATSVVVSGGGEAGRGALIDEAGASTGAIVGDPVSSAVGATTQSDAARHLWMVEQDLDTASTATVVPPTDVPTHLQLIEQDLDTGGAVTPEFDSTPTITPGDSSMTAL